MIAALYSSRQQGTKEFTKDNHQFGWKTVETVFAQEMERAANGLSRKVPGLKYAFVYQDNWTRLNVLPAKIMQVFHYFPAKNEHVRPHHNLKKKKKEKKNSFTWSFPYFRWDILCHVAQSHTSKNILKING